MYKENKGMINNLTFEVEYIKLADLVPVSGPNLYIHSIVRFASDGEREIKRLFLGAWQMQYRAKSVASFNVSDLRRIKRRTDPTTSTSRSPAISHITAVQLPFWI